MYRVLPGFWPNFLGLMEEEKSLHWHGVVVESTGSLGVALEMGVSMSAMQVAYPADTSGLFYHIRSLDTN